MNTLVAHRASTAVATHSFSLRVGSNAFRTHVLLIRVVKPVTMITEIQRVRFNAITAIIDRRHMVPVSRALAIHDLQDTAQVSQESGPA